MYEHPVTFADAAHVCRETLSGQLASITTNEEQDFLTEVYFPIDADELSSDKWIGGIRVSSNDNVSDAFRWVDGSKFNVTHWAAGQPDNDARSQYCMAMFGGEPGRGEWHDFRCDRKLPAICERRLILPKLMEKEGSEFSYFSFEVTDLYARYHAAVHGREKAVRGTYILAFIAASLTAIMTIVTCIGDFSSLRTYCKNRRTAFPFFKFDDSNVQPPQTTT
jgi:hypothetical protein